MAQSLALSGASQALVTAACRYSGCTIRETGGVSPATVRLWDNASAATGTIVETIALTAGQSAREYYADQGIECSSGIFVQVVTGTVEGSLRIGG